jgi:outer membrane scaffolding protein for murein synthesis (MipA/OmpV family)
MTRRGLTALLLLPLLGAASSALAQPPAGAPAPRSNWQLSVGPGVIVTPQYPGAADYQILPIPALDVSYRDRLFFTARRGLGAYAVNDRRNGLEIGGALWFRTARLERLDRARLSGLGRISAAPQLRGFVAKRFGTLTADATAARDLGGTNGATLDLSVSHAERLGTRTFLRIGPSLSFGDARFNRGFFGITPAQAARSGRMTYPIGGGLYQVGVRGALITPVGRRWTLAAFGGYDRLVGDAADSPVVARTGAPSGGLALSYRLR